MSPAARQPTGLRGIASLSDPPPLKTLLFTIKSSQDLKYREPNSFRTDHLTGEQG